MKILVNQKSKIYPKDTIMSYKVIIIQKDTIKKVTDGYTYDAYYFSSINEYNQWKIEEQNKTIEEKDNVINDLNSRLQLLEVVPDLPTRTETNAIDISTALEGIAEVYETILGGN